MNIELYQFFCEEEKRIVNILEAIKIVKEYYESEYLQQSPIVKRQHNKRELSKYKYRKRRLANSSIKPLEGKLTGFKNNAQICSHSPNEEQQCIYCGFQDIIAKYEPRRTSKRKR